MAHDEAIRAEEPRNGHPIPEDLPALTDAAVAAVETILETAHTRQGDLVGGNGRVSDMSIEENQMAAHGLAWLATYARSLRQMHSWGETLEAQGKFGEIERLIQQIAFGEYLCQIQGGIPMNQGEMLRPHDLGLTEDDLRPLTVSRVRTLAMGGNTQAARARLVDLMQAHDADITVGATGLDEELEMIREQFRRFALDHIIPKAHDWHLADELIPMEMIQDLADMGVFGLTIPEKYGGLGLSKATMCVVSEELSRGYIGVGSLGTRSEIAAELILSGGSEEQRQRWLPQIASAEILPTAVFTEPDTGSDLGALRTRATREKSGDYLVSGNKTWITHAMRANLMTLLARTDPKTSNYRGLSMFLAEKPPGTDGNPFPADGMTGGEIEVLGYRGMKEYELRFDNFRIGAENLLGGEEGRGFRQLMETFESARIQTAARAVGVAQSALDAAMDYARERRQFGRQIIVFPRVAGKLAMMAAEIMVARQLTYFSAFEKDQGHRCDLEAGMAKLLAARVAWSAADSGLQIHGGNGFAQEYQISRILCDARVLNIFEGAAEIQAQVIARRLLQ